MIKDSAQLRAHLENLLPGLRIDRPVDTPSGQRVVYFCSFAEVPENPAIPKFSEFGDVVLKVSNGNYASSVARLEQEIEILGFLNSPHYPTLHYFDSYSEDTVTEEKLDPKLFVTIEERIDGPSLSQCKDKFSQEATVVDLIIKLMDALCLLWEHPQKLIHRDIKPENILFRRDGTLVVIDLGIARIESSDGITLTGNDFGPCSPAYASPEQAKNEKSIISFKSDCFAIGTLAHELLTGSNPYKSAADQPFEDILFNVVQTELPTLLELGVSQQPFSDFVAIITQKQPYKRFRTVDILKSELDKLRLHYK
ncbi:MAG: serine/threonine-protein kinase [Ekhidna sp.]